MMTDEEYAREIQWVTRQMRDADNRGELCSPVGFPALIPQSAGISVLCVRKNELVLKARQKTHFRVPLDQITEVMWVRTGISIKLEIQTTAKRYHVQFHSLSGLSAMVSRNINNWFFSFFFKRSRFISRMRPIVEDNFAEAEKWRAIFPDAEFPDTTIKNAKS